MSDEPTEAGHLVVDWHARAIRQTAPTEAPADRTVHDLSGGGWLHMTPGVMTDFLLHGDVFYRLPTGARPAPPTPDR